MNFPIVLTFNPASVPVGIFITIPFTVPIPCYSMTKKRNDKPVITETNTSFHMNGFNWLLLRVPSTNSEGVNDIRAMRFPL